MQNGSWILRSLVYEEIKLEKGKKSLEYGFFIFFFLSPHHPDSHSKNTSVFHVPVCNSVAKNYSSTKKKCWGRICYHRLHLRLCCYLTQTIYWYICSFFIYIFSHWYILSHTVGLIGSKRFSVAKRWKKNHATYALCDTPFSTCFDT